MPYDPTSPIPTADPYPRSWMQPFLDAYTESGHLAQSAEALHVNDETDLFEPVEESAQGLVGM